jgi:hypothetical protein
VSASPGTVRHCSTPAEVPKPARESRWLSTIPRGVYPRHPQTRKAPALRPGESAGVGKARRRSELVVAVVSDQPALLQQPYAVGRHRNAHRRFDGAHQPPAYLGVVDRRIYAIRCGAQVERGTINVPWLRPPPREFVDLGYDFENQGRNAVALPLPKVSRIANRVIYGCCVAALVSVALAVWFLFRPPA